MATLKIQYYNGDVDTRPLKPDQPVSIGKHSSNDIVVDEDSVAVMHCRIAWQGDAYEVVAANLDGVEVNGTLVRSTPLKKGDVLRIGPVDITLQADSDSASPLDTIEDDDDGVGLKPLTAEEIALERRRRRGDPDLEDDDDDGPIRVAGSSSPPRSTRTQGQELPDDFFEDDLEEAPDDLAGQPILHRSKSGVIEAQKGTPSVATAEPSTDETESPLSQIKTRLKPRPKRPGEHDVVRSPVVLLLIGGALTLLLASVVLWFVYGREVTSQQYDAAMEEYEAGKYGQAITLFQKFLDNNPRHELADEARARLGMARVEQQIGGAAPNWGKGYEAVEQFISDNREATGFHERHETIRDYAERIALGAAETAETSDSSIEDREEMLRISENAQRLLVQYSGEDPPTQLLSRIDAAQRKAEKAILKSSTLLAGVAEIEAAIKDKKPMEALAARRRLIERYAEFANDRKVRALLVETMETEKSLVRREDLNRDAITDDHPPPAAPPLVLALNANTDSGLKSEGRVRFAVAKDACFGIDTRTGAVVWRRVIGSDQRFYPILLDTTVPGVLLFDTNRLELVLLNRISGELAWRQPIGEEISGPPLVHSGQIYLPTSGGSLFKIDLASGRASVQMKFSQPVQAPPAVDSQGKWMFLAGDQQVLYALSLRPLECQSVSYLAHTTGSIRSPLVTMGQLLLVFENVGTDRCRLHALDTQNADSGLTVRKTERIEGHVLNEAARRGNQLVVASTGQRLTAFNVTDESGKPPLAFITDTPFQLKTEYDGPLYVTLGPDDQFWLAGGSVRRFEIKTNSIKLDPKEIAVGLSAQPLQMIGSRMYIGRRLPYSSATVFTLADREDMVSQWRTVVGAQVLSMMPTGDSTAICLTEEGDVFRITDDELNGGGFKQKASAQLQVSEKLTEELQSIRFGEDRLLVQAGGEEPRLWIINKLGQVERQFELDEPLEAAPISLQAGLVLPFPGRLTLLSRSGTRSAEDYLAPTASDQPARRWVHLEAMDDDQLIALSEDGSLARIQYRSSPVRSLAPVTSVPLEQPVVYPFVEHEGQLVIGDVTGRLMLLDANSFETREQIALSAPVSNAIWRIDERVYVESGNSKLTCFDLANNLREVWSLDLKPGGLAGPPIFYEEQLLLALLDGEVWLADSEQGTVGNRQNTGQQLVDGPQPLGSQWVVPAVDGSLYPIKLEESP